MFGVCWRWYTKVSSVHTSSCQRVWHAHVLICQRALCAYVLMCQHAFLTHVPTCFECLLCPIILYCYFVVCMERFVEWHHLVHLLGFVYSDPLLCLFNFSEFPNPPRLLWPPPPAYLGSRSTVKVSLKVYKKLH